MKRAEFKNILKSSKVSTEVKNKLIGYSMLGALLFTSGGAMMVHAATDSESDKWGTAADDKTITTANGTDGKSINLLDQEHANYSQSTPFLIPFTFSNDEKLTKAGFSDDLVDGLVFDSVKVYKVDQTIQSQDDVKNIDLSKAKDVTDSGTVDKHANGFKFTFKNPQDAFGQSFVLEVKAHMAADGTEDLTKYADKDGVIHVPNTAHQFWNDTDKPTNTPTIIPPKTVVPTVTKKIVDSDGKLVDKRGVDFNKDYQYVITNNVGSNTKLTKIESDDDLEDVINLKSVKIVDGSSPDGKDISDQFTIKIDHDKESYSAVPKTPTDWANKTWSVVVTGSLQDTPKLMDYLNKNQVEVPNKASLNVNDKVITTPTVIVTPPDVKNSAEKFIEQTKDDSSSTTKDDSKSNSSSNDSKSNSSSSASSSKDAASSSSDK